MKVEGCSSASAQLQVGLLEELEDGNLKKEEEEVVEVVAEVAVQQVQQVPEKGWTGRDQR